MRHVLDYFKRFRSAIRELFLTSLYSNILEHDIIWNENTVTIITFLEIGQLLKLGSGTAAFGLQICKIQLKIAHFLQAKKTLKGLRILQQKSYN